MAKIVNFPNNNNLDIDPYKVLENPPDNLKQVIIIGKTEDGVEYIAASTADKVRLIWALESIKFKILNGDYD